MFGHAHIFFLFRCDLHSFKVLHNKWCSAHHMCIMWKEKIERISGKKNEFLLSAFPMFFSGLEIILMCFDKLIKFYASHHYCIAFVPYDINPFILLWACFNWYGYSCFKREGNLNI
jgi:hypothetical protein